MDVQGRKMVGWSVAAEETTATAVAAARSSAPAMPSTSGPAARRPDPAALIAQALAARHPGLSAAEYQSVIAAMWAILEASQPSA
ncbi:hypothetical protein WMF38_26645 [Sorangium sp. So ce118]